MDPHDTTFLLDQFLISQTLVSVPFVLVTEEIMLYCMQKTHFHTVPSLPSSFRLIPFRSVFVSPVCSFVFWREHAQGLHIFDLYVESMLILHMNLFKK